MSFWAMGFYYIPPISYMVAALTEFKIKKGRAAVNIKRSHFQIRRHSISFKNMKLQSALRWWCHMLLEFYYSIFKCPLRYFMVRNNRWSCVIFPGKSKYACWTDDHHRQVKGISIIYHILVFAQGHRFHGDSLMASFASLYLIYFWFLFLHIF